jgi:hypothetical protein
MFFVRIPHDNREHIVARRPRGLATIADQSGAAKTYCFKDERLLSFYENIRSQVEAERYFAYRFTTGSVRQYAERLREEMDRRRLIYTAIK